MIHNHEVTSSSLVLATKKGLIRLGKSFFDVDTLRFLSAPDRKARP